MPEPLTAEDVKKTQRIIAAVPKGPWEPVPNDFGLLDAVGPISYLECFNGELQVPVIEFVRHAREALPRYIGVCAWQQDHIRALERRIRQLENGEGGAGRVR